MKIYEKPNAEFKIILNNKDIAEGLTGWLEQAGLQSDANITVHAYSAES